MLQTSERTIFENGNETGKKPEGEIKKMHPRIGQLTMEGDSISPRLDR